MLKDDVSNCMIDMQIASANNTKDKRHKTEMKRVGYTRNCVRKRTKMKQEKSDDNKNRNTY